MLTSAAHTADVSTVRAHADYELFLKEKNDVAS